MADANVNIEELSNISSSGQAAHFHLVVNDEAKASQALEKAGISFNKKEALLLKLENVPGTLAKLSKRLGSNDINITSFYVTMKGNQVLGTDNISAAKKVAEEIGAI